MVKIKSKVAIAVIAVAALLIVASIGAAAFWTVQYIVSGNRLESGHLIINAYDTAVGGQAASKLDVGGIMPGDHGKKIYVVESAAGNPITDFAFSVPEVIGNGTLKDNIKVAFALTTAGTKVFWLEPNGPASVPDGENTDNTYANHAFVMSAYRLKSWTGMGGYTSLEAGQIRHLVVYYILPSDCAPDCHDSDVTFDMSFELLQNH